MTNGIYTLANDVVYNQLVALLNSIEVNSPNLSVCVIAYDNRLDLVRQEIANRKNVMLMDNPELFARWDEFSLRVWETHPTALKMWHEKGIKPFYRVSENHRYVAFDPDSPFEKFIYLDADTLVLNSLDFIIDQLDKKDFVIYDFQYKDPSHIFNVNSPKLLEVFSQEMINTKIFCSGFYGAKRGIFPPDRRNWLISKLAEGDAEILYPLAPNQSVLNYMVMKSNIDIYNFALHLPDEQKTGCSVTSTHFKARDNVLYDKDARLTYLHYIGVSSKLFNKLCDGENLECGYRDIFLHYRYLHEPEKQPKFTGKPKLYNPPPSLAKRVLRKLGLKK